MYHYIVGSLTEWLYTTVLLYCFIVGCTRLYTTITMRPLILYIYIYTPLYTPLYCWLYINIYIYTYVYILTSISLLIQCHTLLYYFSDFLPLVMYHTTLRHNHISSDWLETTTAPYCWSYTTVWVFLKIGVAIHYKPYIVIIYPFSWGVPIIRNHHIPYVPQSHLLAVSPTEVETEFRDVPSKTLVFARMDRKEGQPRVTAGRVVI